MDRALVNLDDRPLIMRRYEQGIPVGRTTERSFRAERSLPINVRPFGRRRAVAESSLAFPLSGFASRCHRAPPRADGPLPPLTAPAEVLCLKRPTSTGVGPRRLIATVVFRETVAPIRRRRRRRSWARRLRFVPRGTHASRRHGQASVHCSPRCCCRSAAARETSPAGGSGDRRVAGPETQATLCCRARTRRSPQPLMIPSAEVDRCALRRLLNAPRRRSRATDWLQFGAAPRSYPSSLSALVSRGTRTSRRAIIAHPPARESLDEPERLHVEEYQGIERP